MADLKSAGTGHFNNHCFTQCCTVVFPLTDASSALKAASCIQGEGMLSILLFCASLCGNQHSLAVSGVVFIASTVQTHTRPSE